MDHSPSAPAALREPVKPRRLFVGHQEQQKQADVDSHESCGDDEISELSKSEYRDPPLSLTDSKSELLLDSSHVSACTSKSRRSLLDPIAYSGSDDRSVVSISNYFGSSARSDFNSRLSWCSNKSLISDQGAGDLMKRTQFEVNSNHNMDFPFCPHRQRLKEQQLEHEYEEDESLCGEDSLSGNQKQHDDDGISVASASTLNVSTIVRTASHIRIASPRTKYISGCIKSHRNPRMSLILRRKVTSQLNLQHMGMGDGMGVLFAEALGDLPYVDTIDISDNNLTDASLNSIIKSIVCIPSVTSLNVSQNDVDSVSSTALAEYLRSPVCALRKLILRRADIDDCECGKFVTALTHNTTLELLDLSHNLLGQAETLNTVMPDLVTAGEALGDLLSCGTCHLKSLVVSWNMIRLDGAVAIAESLSDNQYLTSLDLSYNALGREAGEALGGALLTNRTLRDLNIANNSLNFSACFAICVGVEENLSMQQLILDGNPVGEGGGQVLMQIPLCSTTKVKLSATRCNFSVRDENSKFDIRSPDGHYELDMSSHYERAIVIKLMRLVASHTSNVFIRFAYVSKDRMNYAASRLGNTATSTIAKKLTSRTIGFGGEDKALIPSYAKEIELVQVNRVLTASQLDKNEQKTLESLHGIERAAMDVNLCREMFMKCDKDGDGSLNSFELDALLSNVGIKLEPEVLQQAIGVYDIDGTGELDVNEFLDFLKGQREEARARIRSLTEFPVMVLKSDPDQPYVPPTSGTLFVQVGDSYNDKGGAKTVSSVDHANMMDLVRKGVDSVSKTLELSIQNAKLRLKEAKHIYSAMNVEIRDAAVTVAKLLPHMAHAVEARSLMMHAINFDKRSLNRLKKIMGNSLYPLIGIYNGYYSLDLSKEMDRLCMARLLMQSQRHMKYCIDKSLSSKGTTGDLSQLGDWSSFRNAIVNGEPAHISTDLFNPMPKRGTVSFDFCGENKAPRETAVMKDARCVNVLLNMSLAQRKDKRTLEKELRKFTEVAWSALPGRGTFVPINDRIRAEEIHLCMHKFYGRLQTRANQYEKVLAHEEVLVEGEADFADVCREANTLTQDSDSDSDDSLSHVVFDPSELTKIAKQTDMNLDYLNRAVTSTQGKYMSEWNGGSDLKSSRRNAVLSAYPCGSTINEEGEISESDSDDGSSCNSSRNSSSRKESSFDFFATSPKNRKDSVDQEAVIAPSGRRRLGIKHLSKSQEYMIGMSNDMSQIARNVALHHNTKCIRIIEALVDILTRVFIRARHLALIVRWFHAGRLYRTRHFGTYRVELIIHLYSRVVDIHNFDLVLRELSTFETACLYCRMGILYFFNPLKPEGGWYLDISHREERVVAKLLAVLSVVEPGQSWLDEYFRWHHTTDCIPGWELTKSWLTEEGMPRRGLMYVNYYSGEGIKKRGCVADVAMRKSLFHLVWRPV